MWVVTTSVTSEVIGMNNIDWKIRYSREVEESIRKYTELNKTQPVTVRQMTKEEYDNAFGTKPESCHKLKRRDVDDKNENQA